MENPARVLALLGVFLFVGIGSQPAFGTSAQPPTGRTGAPGETTCTACHGGGPTGGMVSLTGIAGGYAPGVSYDLTVQLLNSVQARFGFCVTAVDSTGAAAGTFTLLNTTNSSLQSGIIGGKQRQYVGHKSAGSNKTWTFRWTAPSASTGNVTFYFVGNDANGNGSNSGDTIYTGNLAVAVATSTPVPTDTPTPTKTRTPSNTPTQTFTPSVTPTPSPTLPPCIDLNEPNGLCGIAVPLGLGTPVQGAFCDLFGDKDYFKFTAQTGNRYRIRTFDLGSQSNTKLTLSNAECDVVLASNVDNPATGGPDSYLEYTATFDGDLRVLVEYNGLFSPLNLTEYSLVVDDISDQPTTTPAVTVTPTNTATPIPTCIDLHEPNDTCNTATQINGFGGIAGQHCFPLNEVDYYVFDAQASFTYNVLTTALGPMADTVLTLYDANCSSILAFNDNNPLTGGPDSAVTHLFDRDMRARVKIEPKNVLHTGAGTFYTVFVFKVAPTATPGGPTFTNTPTPTISPTPRPTVVQTIQLRRGWNNITKSVNTIQGLTPATFAALPQPPCSIGLLAFWRDGWRVYRTGLEYNNDAILLAGEGLFAYTNSTSCSFLVMGTAFDSGSPFAVKPGWNFLGIPLGVSFANASGWVTQMADQGLAADYVAGWSNASGSWSIYLPDLGIGDFDVEPGQAHFVFLQSGGVWVAQ